jgi:hypothetical protein
MTDTKQRRTTPRKLAIIQLLATTNKEELEHIYLNTRLFSFSAISMHLFGCYDYDLTKSQKRSLYTTLASMVKDELLVTRQEIKEVSGNPLPQRVTYWHLPDKINDDMAFIARMELEAPERSAKALDKMMRTFYGDNQKLLH